MTAKQLYQAGQLSEAIRALNAEVRDNPTDEGVLQALMTRKPVSQAEIEDWDRRAVNRSPTDEAGWERHWQQLADAGYGDRKDIRTTFDRLDLDDGREVPQGGRSHPLKA